MYHGVGATPLKFGTSVPQMVATSKAWAACLDAGGTWNAAQSTCAMPVAPVPLWVYGAGGLAVLGAAWYFLR